MSLTILKTCDCAGCELKSLFFDKVNELELVSICNSKFEKSFETRDMIVEEGHPIKEYMYLKSGLVKLSRKGNGNREQIIKIAKPFDFVSILSIFSDTHYHYSVTALEPSTVCYIDLELVQSLIIENGVFAFNLLENMSRISDDIIKTMLDIRGRNLRGRIAYVLLYFAKDVYRSNTFELPVSRKEIAEFIEMTTENVIRVLSEFRKDNIIRIYTKTIEITDLDKLQIISSLG